MTWPTRNLFDVADITMGQSPPGKTYNDCGDGLPFFQGKAEFGEESPIPRKWCSAPTRIAKMGDILLSVRAPVGPTNFAPSECCIGRGLAAIRAKDALADQKYLGFVFKYLEPRLSRKGQGSTFSAINRKEIHELLVPLPPISEQQRIVELLDQANALRKKRAEADAKAANILPALFYKMFGDPATWDNTAPLSELVDLQGGGTPSKKNPDYWDGDIPWVSPKDMKKDFLGDAVDHITERALSETNSRLVPLNSILIVVRGMILARHVPLAVSIAPVTINQDMKALTLKEKGALSPFYLFAAMKAQSRRLFAGVGTAAHGTRKLDTDRLLSLPILIPDKDSHARFVEWYQQIREFDRQRLQVAPKLNDLFLVLLHRAFEGSLTAKWRETHLEELLQEMEQQAKALEAASPTEKKGGSRKSGKRHGGHDMFNKAALATYITDRCHAENLPLGRVKLAKLFYLVQRQAELALTEEFAKRAAGPLDDTIHKFLSLACKQKWIVLARAQGDLKPVRPGAHVEKGVVQAEKFLGSAKERIDSMLDTMKDWGWQALERWATVLHAADAIQSGGRDLTVSSIKAEIDKHPDWKPKLDRDEFSDDKLGSTLDGLREWGLLTPASIRDS